MQTTCSRCSQVIFVKDEKLPPGPFVLKCPQCKGTMKMPGKPKASAAPAAPTAQAPPAMEKSPAQPPPPAAEKSGVAAPVTPAAPPGADPGKASAPEPTPKGVPPRPSETPSARTVENVEKQASAEAGSAAVDDPAPAPSTNGNGSLRALVELSESEQVGALETMLRRQGYAVERLRSFKEQSIELQQGRYSLIFTHQNGSPKTGGVQSFINGLAPELRREIFVVLVGDEFKTADGTQAFAAQADLVCRSDELGEADTVLRSTITEKHRLYRAYLEAQSKREAGKL